MVDFFKRIEAFVSGEITCEEFMVFYNSSKEFQVFLQDNIPELMLPRVFLRYSDGDINKAICELNLKRLRQKYLLQLNMRDFLDGNNIEYHFGSNYQERYVFMLDVKPEYIEGEQAEKLIEEIIASTSSDLKKTARIKEIKTRIKQAFHLDNGNKIPRFFNTPDWPFGESGKPLRYVGRKRDGDLVLHTFEDVDSKEQVFVEEYY